MIIAVASGKGGTGKTTVAVNLALTAVRLGRDVHLGDWGVQMGQLLMEVRNEQPELVYFDEDNHGPYPAEAPVTIDDLQRLFLVGHHHEAVVLGGHLLHRLVVHPLEFRLALKGLVDRILCSCKRRLQRSEITFFEQR